MTILHSGILFATSADENYNFEVNRNFYYLTGINQEDVILMIVKGINGVKEYLFLEENDPNYVKWYGAKLYPNEAMEIGGFEESEIHYSSEFEIDRENLPVDKPVIKAHHANNNAILIGKDGRTIAAIQTLLRKSIEKELGLTIKVNVDVANYKEKNLRRKAYEIKKIAYEVQKTKVDVSLEPMNSYERREIHNMIDSIPNVTTESIGEGRERHIVIKYVEEDK